jgi:hypothetical protein
MQWLLILGYFLFFGGTARKLADRRLRQNRNLRSFLFNDGGKVDFGIGVIFAFREKPKIISMPDELIFSSSPLPFYFEINHRANCNAITTITFVLNYVYKYILPEEA